MKNRTFLASSVRFASWFVGACLALGALSFAQGGRGPGQNQPDGTASSSPGEEVTSLPMLAGNEGGGFRLAGDIGSLRALILSIDGSGSIEVTPTLDGEFQLLFHGSFEVQLDTRVLQSGRASVGFQVRSPLDASTGGGFASFSFFGAQPTRFALASLHHGLELPLEMFAGDPGFEGHGFNIAAFHTERGIIHGAVRFGAEHITLTQKSAAF
jgi:hypothetical protein